MTKNGAQTNKRPFILDAATRVLVEDGLPALSFESIAHKAGLSRQLVRYYYADVDTLMIELCDHLAESYREALILGISKVQQPERLDFFLDFFFGLTETVAMPENLEAYDAMFAHAVGSAKLRERLRTHYQLLGRVVEHELAIAYPDLEMAACQELSFLFVSQMHAHWSFVATLRYSDAHNRLARQAFERLVSSYAEKAIQPDENIEPWSDKDRRSG